MMVNVGIRRELFRLRVKSSSGGGVSMLQISVVGDEHICRDDFSRQFAGKFEFEFQPLESVLHASPARYTLLDTNLNDEALVLKLKDWLRRKPKDAKVIFVTDRASRLHDARAYALG